MKIVSYNLRNKNKKMNNVCSGITWSNDAFIKVMEGDWSVIDPDNLIIAKELDFSGLPGEDDWQESWDGAVAMCRAWYDAKNHGKPFCCQAYAVGEEGVDTESTAVLNSSKATSSEPVEVDLREMGLVKLTPYAEAFKSAIKLGGVAIIITAVTLMQ